MKSINFNQITGASAIGSLVLAAIASFTQAFVELRPFFEQLTSSATWGVFIAAPLIILTYLIGQICIEISNVLYDRYYGLQLTEKYQRIRLFYQNGHAAEIEDYKKHEELMELFQGGSLSIAFLGLGLLAKVFTASKDIGGHLEYGRLIFGGVTIALLGLSVLLFQLARNKRKIMEIFLRQQS